MGTTGVDSGALMASVARLATDSGLFGSVGLDQGHLECGAAASAEPASYRMFFEDGALWVSLVMADRWQSESIEADLMHSGDKLEELLDEELADLGYDTAGGTLSYQHFRSDDMLFTFRSRVPIEGLDEGGAVETARQWLFAYEACFRQLGDMDATGDDD